MSSSLVSYCSAIQSTTISKGSMSITTTLRPIDSICVVRVCVVVAAVIVGVMITLSLLVVSLLVMTVMFMMIRFTLDIVVFAFHSISFCSLIIIFWISSLLLLVVSQYTGNFIYSHNFWTLNCWFILYCCLDFVCSW